MKKYIYFICIACFTIVLSACGSQPAKQEDDPHVRTENAGRQAQIPQQENDPLREIVDRMSLEEKAAQMFIARCPEENAEELAGQYKLGGYILFARDFKDSTPDKVRKTIESYQAQADIPMFIGVDEEGGTVNRVSRYTQFRNTPFPSPQALYSRGDMEAVFMDAKEKSECLLDLGINLNFAPVCDVSQDSADFIYDRTLGLGPEKTAEYVRNVVNAMDKAKIGCVLKHFPGYGNNVDTHTGIAHDNRQYQQFLDCDFLPFMAGIEAGAGMVLVSHNIVACMDREFPASLSVRVHEILRKDLGFQGVIITDNLAMDAIGQYIDDEDAAVLAIQAGNDMICCTNFTEQIPAVVQAVKDGKIEEGGLEEAVFRILKLKRKLGIIKE